MSLRYGVLCRFTAFVAVDSRVVTDGAGPHRVTQPVELPAGWDPAELGHPPAVGWVATSAAPAGAGRGERDGRTGDAQARDAHEGEVRARVHAG